LPPIHLFRTAAAAMAVAAAVTAAEWLFAGICSPDCQVNEECRRK
jgi:hypothetical protein